MKISNSPKPTNAADVYQSTMNLEKVHDAIEKIENAQAKQPQDSQDTIALSDQAKKLLEAKQVVDDISNQLENAANSKGSPYDELLKCLEIASRIIKGDKVPQTDIRFLAEKQPELYSSAMFMKQNSENPKRHKSILDNEKADTVEFDTGQAEIKAALAESMPVSDE